MLLVGERGFVFPRLVLRRHGAVVPGVDTCIAVVAGAAMARPEDVPAVAVGLDVRGLGVVWDIEGIVDEGFDALGEIPEHAADAQIPVSVTFDDQSGGDVLGYYSAEVSS